MILISYVEPFIIVQSDKLISGKMIIKSKADRIFLSDNFHNKEYIHVKVQSSWTKSVVVMIYTDGAEKKKVITF